MRNYKRKTNHGKTPKDIMERAVNEVLIAKRPCRAVAKDFEIPHVTLRRYCLKNKNSHRDVTESGNEAIEMRLEKYGYAKRFAVFTSQQEALLVQYLLKASKLYFGLGPKDVRRLAFDYATRMSLDFPQAWADNEMAGRDWMTSFLKRHKKISLRAPEATSLGRATSFNRHNVSLFFTNYEAVLEKYAFTPDKIWNLDESGCTTVQRPGKIIAETGCKQVDAVVSSERGQLVTICCAISATGNTVPPMFVFPRVHFRDHFLQGAPTGSIGAAHPSGWMTGKTFLTFMRHFVAHVNCTPENKVLLILDNHDSHISLDAIDYARENGVVLLSFPPHCSHKMQPLDRTVFGPFKMHYNAAADAWMRENKGKTMTIYEIPVLVGKAFPRAMTPVNIQSGFRVSGIYPLDRNIFTDDEFLPSDVTDRPLNNHDVAMPEITNKPSTSVAEVSNILEPVSSVSRAFDVQQIQNNITTELTNDGPSTSLLSPEDIHPFKKAAPRKKTGGRKPGRTRILTSTPVRKEIAEEAGKRELKKTTASKKKPKSARCLVEVTQQELETSSEDESMPDMTSDEEEPSDCHNTADNQVLGNPVDAKVGDYILLRYAGKKMVHYFVGLMEDINDDDQITSKIMKRLPTKDNSERYTFAIRDNAELFTHEREDVVFILPKPSSTGGTRRCQQQILFPVDLSAYKPG